MSKQSRPSKQAPRVKRPSAARSGSEGLADAELSPAQRRELDKRVADLKDRTRYMLLCTLGPGFVLYYNVTEDTYSWNDPGQATLFKRRKAALAIQQLLGDKDWLVACQVNQRGQLIKKSVVVPTELPRRGKKTKKSRG